MFAELLFGDFSKDSLGIGKARGPLSGPDVEASERQSSFGWFLTEGLE